MTTTTTTITRTNQKELKNLDTKSYTVIKPPFRVGNKGVYKEYGGRDKEEETLRSI